MGLVNHVKNEKMKMCSKTSISEEKIYPRSEGLSHFFRGMGCRPLMADAFEGSDKFNGKIEWAVVLEQLSYRKDTETIIIYFWKKGLYILWQQIFRKTSAKDSALLDNTIQCLVDDAIREVIFNRLISFHDITRLS